MAFGTGKNSGLDEIASNRDKYVVIEDSRASYMSILVSDPFKLSCLVHGHAGEHEEDVPSPPV